MCSKTKRVHVLQIANYTSRRQFGTHGALIHNTYICKYMSPAVSGPYRRGSSSSSADASATAAVAGKSSATVASAVAASGAKEKGGMRPSQTMNRGATPG